VFREILGKIEVKKFVEGVSKFRPPDPPFQKKDNLGKEEGLLFIRFFFPHFNYCGFSFCIFRIRKRFNHTA